MWGLNKKVEKGLLNNILMLFNVYGSVHRNNILIYIHQDATLHSSFYLETALHLLPAAIAAGSSNGVT
jgi:hypothetical protein